MTSRTETMSQDDYQKHIQIVAARKGPSRPTLPITREQITNLTVDCDASNRVPAVLVPVDQLRTLLAIARMSIGRNQGNVGFIPPAEWYEEWPTGSEAPPMRCVDCGSYDVKPEGSK